MVWHFKGSIDGTVSIPIVTVGPVPENPTEAQSTHFAVHSGARLSVDVPEAVEPKLVRRLSIKTWMDYDAPVVVSGKPAAPRFFGRDAQTGTAHTGIGHMRPFPDPDPVWGGSDWDIPPPPAPPGASFVRWTVKDLPDPSGYPNHEYAVGTRSTVDSTNTQPASTAQWNSSDGSDFSIPWQSAYPFKPWVRSHYHYGPDNSLYIEPKGLFFNADHVEHMWADFGTLFTPPFTFAVVGCVLHHPDNGYNWIMDTGVSPISYFTDAQRLRFLKKGFTGTQSLVEAYGYRTAMRTSPKRMSIFNDQAPVNRIGRAPFTHTLRPKMFFMVIDGANSMLGNWSVTKRHTRNTKLADNGQQRLAVLGRKNGIIASGQASNMVIFEIRAWDKALSSDYLSKHFNQLTTTWHLHDYHWQGRL